jgi:hypothetical protein
MLELARTRGLWIERPCCTSAPACYDARMVNDLLEFEDMAPAARVDVIAEVLARYDHDGRNMLLRDPLALGIECQAYCVDAPASVLGAILSDDDRERLRDIAEAALISRLPLPGIRRSRVD